MTVRTKKSRSSRQPLDGFLSKDRISRRVATAERSAGRHAHGALYDFVTLSPEICNSALQHVTESRISHSCPSTRPVEFQVQVRRPEPLVDALRLQIPGM